MKKLLIIILCIISINVFANIHEYDVSGEDENGITMEGTVESTNGSRDVSGTLTDEYGNDHDFSGEWDGYKEISGETDDGASITLDVD